MRLIRRHITSGTEHTVEVDSMAEAEKQITWCAIDNFDLGKADAGVLAARAVHEFRCGRPFRLGSYEFTAVVAQSGPRDVGSVMEARYTLTAAGMAATEGRRRSA